MRQRFASAAIFSVSAGICFSRDAFCGKSRSLITSIRINATGELSGTLPWSLSFLSAADRHIFLTTGIVLFSSCERRFCGLPDRFDPIQEPVAGHEIQDAFLRDAGAQGRGCREFDKSKLRRTVRIGAEGNPAARLFRNHEQVRTEILPVRIGVDFDGLVQFRCLGKDPRPVRGQTPAVVIDAPARMAKNLKGRIAQGREITALSDPPSAAGMNGSSR